MSATQTIVIGGGLAGISAAHTLLERGVRVVLLDKKQSLGGNAVKASSGINGANTAAQRAAGIEDSIQAFAADTTASAGAPLARPNLVDVLTSNSASAVEWLTATHGVDLSVVSQLGGHSIARTHRDTKGSPGWAIMSKLIKSIEELASRESARISVLKNARVVRILQEGAIVSGVKYEIGGESVTLSGDVIIATGGYAADFSEGGYLSQYRSDLLGVPTTNGDHATGDGHRLSTALELNPAVLVDMDQVQVHPTGFIDPAKPDASTKFLAAEALRAVGGLLLNSRGERFVNEIDTRDKVTAAMQKVIATGAGPIRLLLNEAAAKEVGGHCVFYQAKGLMQSYANLQELAAGTGLKADVLRRTFELHSQAVHGEETDAYGKRYFHNADYKRDQVYLSALITPVVHYTMGGITVDTSARALSAVGKPIPGLFAVGEVIGGVHGQNRLGGSSLLEAVVFGRIAGRIAGSNEL